MRNDGSLESRWWLLSGYLLAIASCSDAATLQQEWIEPASDTHATDPASTEGAPAGEIAEVTEAARPRRGIGTMTARVPGSDTVVGGVRLLSHHARTVIQDGFARTELEEEFLNETGRVLEGRYVFPLPPGASISRLGLWVGSTLVEGEIVERERARRIFRGIVEDTVRPRDPALLEWVRGSEFSMTIFPIPANSARKVVLAYDEVLRADDGTLRYVLPLSLGEERAVSIEDFSISVEVVGENGAPPADLRTPGWVTRASTEGRRTHLAFDEAQARPDKDFVVELPAPAGDAASLVTFTEAGVETFAARLVIPTEIARASIDTGSRDRVVVVDASDSQSKETLAAQARLAISLVRSMGAGERFAVLACDSACEAHPPSGLADATRDSVASLETWLAGVRPRGSSDLSGAIQEGVSRLESEEPGQLVVLHDGKASAGELATHEIAARVAPVLAPRRIDLRFIGAGRSLDEAQLGGLARALGAAYEPLAGTGSLADRIAELGRDLDRPLLVNPRIELPEAFTEARPSTLSSMRLGESITLVGKVGGGVRTGSARVTGEVDGEPVEVEVPIRIAADAPTNPLLPRLWAEREMAEIEAAGGDDARARVVALSKQSHVLSRYTSLLVLENERMFAEFGIARTTLDAADQSDHGFGRDEASAGPSALGSGSPLAEQTAGGAGFGSGHGRLGGAHVARPPQIRMGMTMVSGRLPPETIQRIIRLNAGRFRACYERGLTRNPNLAGRVVTRFVIDRAGQVPSSEDGGSDLADPEVVACVVRNFRSLDFPQPEGGIVTVVYPLVFSSDGTRPRAPVALWPEPPFVPRAPVPREEPSELTRWREMESRRLRLSRGGPQVKLTVVHSAGDERWREARAAELVSLEQAAAAAPTSRARRERWVRALVQQGRFDRARDEARRFVELDPDLALARELLAQSEAILGDDRAALAQVDSLAEADARSANAHLRAARAFAAAGDERRECAHLRSLAEIEGTPAARARAESCRARASAGAPVLADVPPTGVFEARVECEDAAIACPEVAVVTPSGRVISRAAPFAAIPDATGLSLLAAGGGSYRTVLFGGDPRARGRVSLRVHGKTATFPFEPGHLRTVATTRIEERWSWRAIVRI